MLRVSKSPSESLIELNVRFAVPRQKRKGKKMDKGRKPYGMVVGIETGRRKRKETTTNGYVSYLQLAVVVGAAVVVPPCVTIPCVFVL
jgi:hypothetical protein